ncbi:hypothetical protein C8F01DRAFT_1137036 [Mycena amicta]|nr:hypothetical protein C8F01DRAFT_1137036 [Mycena amicta]
MAADEYPKFSFEATAEEVATAFADQIKGKNVLITGTSLKGIGFDAARAIAKYANLVIITGYNDERLKLSEQALKTENPTATIRRLILDLSSLASVRKAAAEVNAYAEPLHVLIHNAAAHFGPQLVLSAEGLDNQWSVAHVGPFLFTKLLASKLLAATSDAYTPRVVSVSGAGHAWIDGIDFSRLVKPDLKAGETYDGWNVCCQANSAIVATAIELSRRSQNKILGYSLHPGVIFTNIHLNPDTIPMLKASGSLTDDGKPNPDTHQWKTLAQGAATTVMAAFDPRLVQTPGAYLDDSTIANDKIAPHASDPVIGAKLWATTEEIVGEKFEF